MNSYDTNKTQYYPLVVANTHCIVGPGHVALWMAKPQPILSTVFSSLFYRITLWKLHCNTCTLPILKMELTEQLIQRFNRASEEVNTKSGPLNLTHQWVWDQVNNQGSSEMRRYLLEYRPNTTTHPRSGRSTDLQQSQKCENIHSQTLSKHNIMSFRTYDSVYLLCYKVGLASFSGDICVHSHAPSVSMGGKIGSLNITGYWTIKICTINTYRRVVVFW